MALGLVIIAALVYAPARDCGFIWDDDDYITNNEVLTEPGGLARIWFEPTSIPQYYPLIHTTFWLEHRLGGMDPAGFHVVNILLHGLASAILFLLLRRLEVPFPWVCAALFAVHPVGVESVAWVTERKNVLSLLFFLLSLHYWWRHRQEETLGLRQCATLVLLFVCALLSKSVTATLPFVMLLLVWWKQGHIGRADIKLAVPMILLGAASGVLTAYLERVHVGAAEALPSMEFSQRLALAGRASTFYAQKIVWPHPLLFSYEKWDLDSWGALHFLPTILVLLTVGFLFVLRRRIGRGPVTGVLFFLGVLTPALGFFDVFPFRYSYVADHFQYHASIGLITLLGASLLRAVQSYGSTSLALGLAAVLLFALAFKTHRQIEPYKDLPSIWEHTLEGNPNSTLACSNLSPFLIHEGEYKEARILLERCLEQDPLMFEAHANLGVVDYEEGHIEEARSRFERALEIKPGHVMSLLNLAEVEWSHGSKDQAFSYLAKVREESPDHLNVLRTEVKFMMGSGRYKEAVPRLRRILELRPDQIVYLGSLGEALIRSGSSTEGMQVLNRYLKAAPADHGARLLGAQTLLKKGRASKAAAQFAAVLGQLPKSQDAFDGLVVTLASLSGDLEATRKGVASLCPRSAHLAYKAVADRLKGHDPQAAQTALKIAIELANAQGHQDLAQRWRDRGLR